MPVLAHLFPPTRTDKEKSPPSPRRKRSAADLRRFVTTFLPNMGSNNQVNHNPHPSLNLLVLLPSAAHLHQLPGPPPRPSPISRKSSSAVSSLQSIPAGQPTSGLASGRTNQGENGPSQASLTNRRLSLATGIGIGAGPINYTPTGNDADSISPTSTPAPPTPNGETASSERTSSSIPAFGSKSVSSTTPYSPPISGVPAFGTRRSTGTGSRISRRRPQTATSGIESSIAPALMGMGMGGGRSSLAVPGGMAHSSRTRPGWEADEVVGTLRGCGMEVTVIRHASHLPALLDPSSTSTFAAPSIARSSDPHEPLTQVILVPLSDSPAFPSLSLLLQQGTTPTAVCFQQDLLDRAKRSEDEWLPGALDQIRSISRMRETVSRHSNSANSSATSLNMPAGGTPVIIAYSANPSITQVAINACISAGATGVLKPPYEFDIADLVMKMVTAHREGRSLSTVISPGDGRVASPLSRSPAGTPSSEETTVVLPPTALDMGAEHEGERVLGAAVSGGPTAHRKSSSGSWNSETNHRSSVSGLARKPSVQNANKGSSRLSPLLNEPSSSASLGKFTFQPLPSDFSLPKPSHFTFYNTDFNLRRRSVDIGGLSLALKRASLAYEESSNQPIGTTLSQIKEGYSFPPTTPTKKSSGTSKSALTGADEEGEGTELAELLSAMFCHSMTTIEVQMGDYEALSAPLTQEHREKLIHDLSTWNFKPHNLPEGDLYRVACLMFECILSSEGLKELQIERDQINRLLFAIRAIYHRPNPYHNYVHAIDVLQATYMFLVQIGVAPPFSYMRDWTPQKPAWQRSDQSDREISVGTRRAREVMRPQDVLGVLVAAMGHDVGHPGLSNAFMKNANVPLSQVYEDKSVLENMHCMLIVQLLRKHGFGFLIEGSKPQSSHHLDQKGFRRVLYSSVLATDMSLHFAWIQRLKDFDETLREGEVGEDEYDRVMICQALMKCADISNPTRPIDVSQYWSSVLLEEWAKQASLESDLDLPVSVVASADAALQARGQIGFIDLFTLPLFEAVSEALPELQVYADSCADNRDVWQRRLDQLNSTTEENGIAGSNVGGRSKEMIQPIVEGASHDERFKTLFPLLLPTSLISGMESDSTNEDQDQDQGIDSQPTTPPTPNTLNIDTNSNSNSNSNMHTSTNSNSTAQQQSPAAKAIRSVYKAKLGDSGSKGRSTSSSWARSLAEWNEGRRMSTPEVVVSHGDFH
ncbi:uncharacterized protein IL334_003875 [Kwoniella shivajii]|uniref:Phosphodiesterase n=1 Tax=Kwoniella shivajii TaxID=564305 RepID=A0ABZ1CYT3_9TREE|nr:hypothetical protein IL334_003875 [Kwoniella shivajii]